MGISALATYPAVSTRFNMRVGASIHGILAYHSRHDHAVLNLCVVFYQPTTAGFRARRRVPPALVLHGFS